MNRLLAALALALFVGGGSARAASTYSVLTDASSTTIKLNGRLHMQSLAGVEQLVIDSVRGLFTWTYGIQASTANFTGTGNTTYSLTTSSGVSVAAGGVTAPWFSASTGFFGSLFGNATTATSATTATTATNLAGGAAGQVHYQSGAGASAFLTAGAATQALMGGASAPAWSTLAGSTIAANISGLAAQATALGATPTHCTGQASTGVDINGNAIGCFSAGTGDVTQAGNNTMTGVNVFNGVIRSSSWSVTNVATTQNAGALGVCVSSVTITPVGSTVTVKGNGSVSVTGSGTRAGVGVLQNGAYVLGESNTGALGGLASGFVASGTNIPVPMSFERTLTGLTPGTGYTFCIGFINDASATVTIPATSAANYQFLVEETTLK